LPHHFRVSLPSDTTETPALLLQTTVIMSADDIDDELFALAGGDEENDIEEGEA
jgi:hypothetical protein